MTNRKRISTSPDNVLASLASIERCVAAIEAELDQLDHTAARLSGLWSGEAQEAYSTAHRDVAESFRELARVGAQLSGIARRATHGFTHVESKNAGAWR